MKKTSEAEKLAVEIIDFLQTKLKEVNRMIKSHSTFGEEKTLDRMRVAIMLSIEALRRAKMDNGIPNFIRR